MAEPIKRGFSALDEDKARPSGGTMDSVKDKARDVAASAAELAAQGKDKVKQWGTAAADRAEGAREAVGGTMASLGGAIRDKGPQRGVLGAAGTAVADKLESAGHYLEGHTFRDMGNDLTSLVRRHPIPSLLAGLGLGFLLARMTRS